MRPRDCQPRQHQLKSQSRLALPSSSRRVSGQLQAQAGAIMTCALCMFSCMLIGYLARHAFQT